MVCVYMFQYMLYFLEAAFFIFLVNLFLFLCLGTDFFVNIVFVYKETI